MTVIMFRESLVEAESQNPANWRLYFGVHRWSAATTVARWTVVKRSGGTCA